MSRAVAVTAPVLLAGLALAALAACQDERPIPLPAPSRPDRRVVVDGAAADDAEDPEADGGARPDAAPALDARVALDAELGEDAAAARDAEVSMDGGGPPDAGNPRADLAARFGTPVPTHVAPGANVTLIVEVQNVGGALAPPSELSVDLRLFGAPGAQAVRLTQVGVRSLDVGLTETLTLSLAMPASLAPGTYVLRAVADPGQLLAEPSEVDNVAEANVSASGLDVTPATLALGPVAVGCEAMAGEILVRNVGGVAATLQSAAVSGGTAELRLGPVALPLTVQPGGQARLTVGYLPADVGLDRGQLSLGFMQGVAGMLVVPLTGEGRAAMQRTDTFQQSSSVSRLDLLMMIDNSCSMSEEQAQLAGQVPQFLAWAQQNSVDFRVAVVTTDMDAASESGRFQGSPLILTPSTPNLTQAFSANIQRGVNGSGNEAGLDAVVAALTPPLSTGPNTGFLRSDAALGVLFLSDEEDSSMITPQATISALTGLKPGGVVRVNAIVSPQGLCANATSEGARYTEVANAFGGTVDSICSASWSSPLTSWGMLGGAASRFTLSRRARPSGITVRVNGASVAGGMGTWSFDAAGNAVVFSTGAVPPLGATVEIAYTEACGP